MTYVPLNLKPIWHSSYQNQKEASKSLGNLGYKYDNELSTNDAKVFIDKDGKPNIAFRGTHNMRWKDIKSDIALGLGLSKYDTRFQEAKRLTRLVEDKYHSQANAYGDSLGGSLAEFSGAKGQIFTHNKGVGIGDLFKNIPQKQHDYRNKNDIVSLLSLTQQHDNNNLHEMDTNKGTYDVLGNHKISA